jgi:perosamine synthetase
VTIPQSVIRFQDAFAACVGARRAWAFWKGRVALYAILRALGIGKDDEVILPGYTCVMNVNPIKYLGARPVYVDIDPVTYNLDPSLVEAAFTPHTKVLIAQHTYGYPCDMDALLAMARQRGVAVVEDCCLALGARYKGQMCGTFGAAAYWSFQWNKPFTTGLGGMAATRDAGLADRIDAVCAEGLEAPPAKASALLALQRLVYRTLIFPRTTAAATRLFRWLSARGLVIGSSASEEFSPVMPAGFFRQMSAGQARAGLRQVRRLEQNMAHRRAMRTLYEALLREAGWAVPQIPESMAPILVRYPVRVADKARAVTEAPRHRVELGTWFECPLHPIETPLAQYDYTPGQCPVAEQASQEVVNLPMHPRAGQATARRSVALVAGIGRPIPKT